VQQERQVDKNEMEEKKYFRFFVGAQAKNPNNRKVSENQKPKRTEAREEGHSDGKVTFLSNDERRVMKTQVRRKSTLRNYELRA